MKTNCWLIACLLILFSIAACTPPVEPVSVTRPVTLMATAVPPTNTPPATLTISPTSTIAPTNTPDPAAAQTNFLETLQLELNGRQLDALQAKLNTPFLAGIYPATTMLTEPDNVMPHLQSRLLNLSPNITFYALDSAEIPAHLTAAKLFGGNAGQITIVGSSGWGLRGSGQALIYLLADGDSYRWTGLVVGYGDFEADLELETIAAPPGLTYLIENGRYEYWQIDANGDPQLLIAHDGRLSLNPTATLALSAEIEDEFVTLFDLANGSSEVIEVDGRLMASSYRMQWLNAETALLMITDEENVSQNTQGFPALLNVTAREINRLDLELSIYTQPAISASGVIALEINESEKLAIWQDGQLKTVTVTGLQSWPQSLWNPHLSPDVTQVVGRTSTHTEPWQAAYGLASLDQPEFTVLQVFDPIGTDAVVSPGIHWSPDGQWVALTPSSFDPLENGSWLVKTDGSIKIHLGPASSPPVWLDANRVVFSAVWNGQYGLQLYDLAANQRFWLDTPQFAGTLRDGFWLDAEKLMSPVQFVTGVE